MAAMVSTKGKVCFACQFHLIAQPNSFSITSETSTGSSIHGSYRNINDPENIMKVDKSDAGSLEEPKSGFRNKVKTAFKLKSRAPTGSQDNVKEPDSSKDSNEDFFGPNLELVLKDSDFVTVPRIVVECLEILGKNVNIKTPGLYRVSGNKTVIETLKKKLNEKKLSKKAVLKDQDIHNISGILKMFFRELKPPLLDSNTFIQCTTGNYHEIFDRSVMQRHRFFHRQSDSRRNQIIA